PLIILYATPVRAQGGAGESQAALNTRYAAVLDFTDSSHTNNPFIGRQAADAVANSLTTAAANPQPGQLDWQVIGRDVVESALREAHLQLPLDAAGIRQLAQTIRNPAQGPGRI